MIVHHFESTFSRVTDGKVNLHFRDMVVLSFYCKHLLELTVLQEQVQPLASCFPTHHRAY
jgi:predicted SAM-dependent methyltransferase